ncbi:MAG TPA: MASE1 domain-containing protein [Gemmatimonadales bacterium]
MAPDPLVPVLDTAPAAPLHTPRPRRWIVAATLLAVYILAGKLGLSVAFLNASASAVWPPTGIALAAYLLFGEWVWPVIFLGAFAVNVTTAGTIGTSLAIAAGNTLEAGVAAVLVRQFARGAGSFDRARDAFLFSGLAALLATTVSATTGVGSLAIAGLVPNDQFGSVWLTWWLGDLNGALTIAPLILLWARGSKMVWTRAARIEAVILFAGIVVIGVFVFGGVVSQPLNSGYPLEFLSLPLFVWAAFRLSQREAITAACLAEAIAIWGTLHNHGPFARRDPNESLLLLQAFMAVATLMTLALAAEVAERRSVEERLFQLSVSDAMTGISNYRHLIASLEREIERSRRTERAFSILFLDLDHLKKINDAHGHLVGSEALRRVARVLRRSSRAIDTVARFGGDEFAIVLPEADETAARMVMSRISTHLGNDETQPPIAVSAGVAVFPRDGKTLEELLGAADKALYRAKAARG